MTYAELMNQIRELGETINARAQSLSAMAADPNASMEQLKAAQDALSAMQARMTALQASAQAMRADAGEQLGTPAPQAAAEEADLHAVLSSREYARAFADAIRIGARPGRDMAADRHAPLYKALTIAGGSPAGSEGGFLVPEDINTMINEQKRHLMPLAEVFNQEVVSSNSGWRVTDTAPTSGFTKVTAELAQVPTDAAPTFAKVSFTLDTYGLIIPVSNELAADETAGLFSYLARYFAKKEVITENSLLLGLLGALTATSITTGTLAALKTAVNATLDPAISASAHWIMNQNAFQALDALADDNGRPLLQPNPTNPTDAMLLGRPVHVLSNAMLPDESDASPIFVGDFKSFGTLFRREPMEIVSTDIGGNAFRTNSIEVRGIVRLDAATYDAAAAAALKL